MTIENPQIECQETPENLGVSKVIAVEKDEFRRGIILDSLDELIHAIKVYNGEAEPGYVEGARATQDNLIEAMDKSYGGLAGALTAIGSKLSTQGFTERFIKEITEKLEEKGRYFKSFDYDAMGTNFFKTSVEINETDGKYVLELNAAYVGSKPEQELAKTLEKPRALVRSMAKCKLSIVDDWWFNVDLGAVLESLTIPKEQIRKAGRYFVSQLWQDDPGKMIFEHNGQKFSLGIGFDVIRYLHPESNRDVRYIQNRGDFVAGPAWTIWEKDGNTEIPPKPFNPSIVLSVCLANEEGSYPDPVAVTKEKMQTLRKARDYLAEMIKVK